MNCSDLLANPIWHSLSTRHAQLAEGNPLAKRYPRDIGPLSAIPEQSPETWEALKGLFSPVDRPPGEQSPGDQSRGDQSPGDLSPGDQCGLFLTGPAKLVPGLTLTVQFQLEQMLCESASAAAAADGFDIQELGEDDVPEMLELTRLAEPGPFRNRTIQLGGYRGIREGGRLVAMAGRRTAVPGYREISAVCTHPDYRGKGYAAALVSAVGEGIVGMGERPYLHVRQDNLGAIRLYRRLGYEVIRTFYCAVVGRAEA
jgi:ribosomal protein S18 acetylase RimI-like enzyme